MQTPISACLKSAALTLTLALTLLVGSAGAQQPATSVQYYDVELVVFRQLNSNATPEEWGSELAVTEPAPQQEEIVLPPSEEEAAAGGTASATAPEATALETFAALSSAKFKLNSIAESLRRSRNYEPVGHFGWTQPGYPYPEAHYMSIDPLAVQSLTGRVAMSRGRYLHLTLDFAFQDDTGQRYTLRQTRLMRSSEKHYIDHPKFGVIALVTPVGT